MLNKDDIIEALERAVAGKPEGYKYKARLGGACSQCGEPESDRSHGAPCSEAA